VNPISESIRKQSPPNERVHSMGMMDVETNDGEASDDLMLKVHEYQFLFKKDVEHVHLRIY